MADEGRPAAVAARGDLVEENSGVGASGVPAFAQVGLELIEHAGAVAGSVAGQQLIDRVGPSEAAHRSAREAESAADFVDGNTFGEHCMHGGVTFPRPHRPPVRPVTRPGGGRPQRRVAATGLAATIARLAGTGASAGPRGERGGQAASMAGDATFDRLSQVVPDMPSISHLDRVRCTVASALGVGAGTVSAHDLDAGMRTQPVSQGLGSAVGEHVDRSASLGIDQQRAVPVAAAQGKIVHSQHTRRWPVGIRQRTHDTQQRHPADRRRQLTSQPRPRPTAQRQPDRAQHSLQNPGAPGIPSSQAGYLLGERRLGTVGVVAEQPPDCQPNQHLPPGGRGVGQAALVATVHPIRHRPAPRTRRWLAAGPDSDLHHAASSRHGLDPYPGQMRPQHRNKIKINAPQT